MHNKQTPLHSGFAAASTASDVVAGRDLTGLTAIVTGGHSGLGLETARVLALAGAHVIVAARDTGKARDAVQGISGIDVEALDLMDPASIDAFATRFLARGMPLNLLINNAGIMAPPLQRDSQGHESQFATNHLGHFRLTGKLWPALRQAGGTTGARVVSVSSGGHRIAGIDFDDPHFERRGYDKWQAYGQSKTANALFAVELDRRGAAHGVRAFSLHPGAIFTPLQRHMTLDDYRALGALDENGNLRSGADAGFKTVEQGAATSLWCATSPLLNGRGGLYCEDCDVAPMFSGNPQDRRGVSAWAVDTALARRLWDLSEELTGLAFGHQM